jgi:hypothetical protein
MLRGVILSAAFLYCSAECCYVQCHYAAECRCAECYGPVKLLCYGRKILYNFYCAAPWCFTQALTRELLLMGKAQYSCDLLVLISLDQLLFEMKILLISVAKKLP